MVILDIVKATSPIIVLITPTLIPHPISSSTFYLDDGGTAPAHHPSRGLGVEETSKALLCCFF